MKGHTIWPNREEPIYKVTINYVKAENDIAGIILTHLTENS